MTARHARLAIAALLTVPLVPLTVMADPSAAMDSCVQTFLTSDAAKDRKVVVRRNSGSTPRPYGLSGRYAIEVVAKNRDTGRQLARIVCHVNRKGEIVARHEHPTPSVASVALVR